MSRYFFSVLNLILYLFEKSKGNENIVYKWFYYIILSVYCFIKEKEL